MKILDDESQDTRKIQTLISYAKSSIFGSFILKEFNLRLYCSSWFLDNEASLNALRMQSTMNSKWALLILAVLSNHLASSGRQMSPSSSLRDDDLESSESVYFPQLVDENELIATYGSKFSGSAPISKGSFRKHEKFSKGGAAAEKLSDLSESSSKHVKGKKEKSSVSRTTESSYVKYLTETYYSSHAEKTTPATPRREHPKRKQQTFFQQAFQAEPEGLSAQADTSVEAQAFSLPRGRKVPENQRKSGGRKQGARVTGKAATSYGERLPPLSELSYVEPVVYDFGESNSVVLQSGSYTEDNNGEGEVEGVTEATPVPGNQYQEARVQSSSQYQEGNQRETQRPFTLAVSRQRQEVTPVQYNSQGATPTQYESRGVTPVRYNTQEQGTNFQSQQLNRVRYVGPPAVPLTPARQRQQERRPNQPVNTSKARVQDGGYGTRSRQSSEPGLQRPVTATKKAQLAPSPDVYSQVESVEVVEQRQLPQGTSGGSFRGTEERKQQDNRQSGQVSPINLPQRGIPGASLVAIYNIKYYVFVNFYHLLHMNLFQIAVTFCAVIEIYLLNVDA